MREHRGCFAARVSAENCPPVNLHGWYELAPLAYHLPQRVNQVLILQRLRGSRQEDMQPIVFLNDLPSAHRQRIEERREEVRKDPFFASCGGRKIEYFYHPALDGLNEGKGASAGTALKTGSLHQVTDLIAKQGLSVAKEHGEQHFLALFAGRNRAV